MEPVSRQFGRGGPPTAARGTLRVFHRRCVFCKASFRNQSNLYSKVGLIQPCFYANTFIFWIIYIIALSDMQGTLNTH